MKRIVLAAALIVVGGTAGAASAPDESKPARSHTMSGRTLVWHQPKAETPYALTGRASPAPAEKPRIEVQPHGRAGTTYKIDAPSGR